MRTFTVTMLKPEPPQPLAIKSALDVYNLAYDVWRLYTLYYVRVLRQHTDVVVILGELYKWGGDSVCNQVIDIVRTLPDVLQVVRDITEIENVRGIPSYLAIRHMVLEAVLTLYNEIELEKWSAENAPTATVTLE